MSVDGGGRDTSPDALVDGDAGDTNIADALPPVDVQPFDADRTGCPTTSPIYVITVETGTLYAFDPPSALFKRIAKLACPGVQGSHPKSMSVNRAGNAYVLFDTSALLSVATTNGACATTSYVRSQEVDFLNFGMSYSTNGGGPSETLFVVSEPTAVGRPRLGTLDGNLHLGIVGAIDVPPGTSMDLTGNASGALFGFAPGDTDSFIVQLDKQTAAIVAETKLPGVSGSYAIAFSFWGDAFYLFTSHGPGFGSTVTRYRPRDGSIVDVASHAETIIGAGSSTCAPD